MPLDVQAIPVLSDNYAWFLRDTETGTTAVVDPGEATPVADFIEKEGGRLDLILLTHHHHDHTGGAEALRQRYHARVAGPAAEQQRMPPLDIALHDQDSIAVGACIGTVIAVPGHTLGHICYDFPNPPSLFCGDTLFSLGCGRLFEALPNRCLKACTSWIRCQMQHVYIADTNTRWATAPLPCMQSHIMRP